MNPLSSLPAWAFEGLVALLVAAGKLMMAKDDEAREEALMQAAEDLKASLDKRKFGS